MNMNFRVVLVLMALMVFLPVALVLGVAGQQEFAALVGSIGGVIFACVLLLGTLVDSADRSLRACAYSWLFTFCCICLLLNLHVFQVFRLGESPLSVLAGLMLGSLVVARLFSGRS